MIKEAYSKLSSIGKYITAAKKGEKIYIGGFGKPEVLMVKISEKENNALNMRIFSLAKGKVTATPDAFSETTDQSIAALMQDGR